jgi:hypothetical protein
MLKQNEILGLNTIHPQGGSTIKGTLLKLTLQTYILSPTSARGVLAGWHMCVR